MGKFRMVRTDERGVVVVYCDVLGCTGGGEPDAVRGGGSRVHRDVPPYCARKAELPAHRPADAASWWATGLLLALLGAAAWFGWRAVFR
jgi:hypothetical protein